MPEADVPALVQNSPAAPSEMGISPGVFAGMEENLRGKIKAEESAFGQIEGAYARRTPQMEQAFAASGAEAAKLQPWNAKEKEAEFYHSPLEAFGSLGSVFGIIASAFTHAPMENALNASAAAMTAIKEGDEKSYKNAYTAWKDNMALVEKRHNMERDHFQDAFTLLKTDLGAGEAKLKHAMTISGDKQGLMLLEAGLGHEKIWEMYEARNKSVQGMMKTSEMLTEQRMKTDVRNRVLEETQSIQDPIARAIRQEDIIRTIEGLGKDPTDPKRTLLRKFLIEHRKDNDGMGPTAEEISTFVADNNIVPQQRTTPELVAQDALIQERADAGQPPPTATELADVAARARRGGGTGAGGGAGVNTPGRQETRAIEDRIKQLQEEAAARGETLSYADAFEKAKKQTKVNTATPSGNRMDDIQSRIDRVGFMTQTIDKVEALLTKHKGLAGVGGKVLRPAESIGNIFGSNETDRREFERLVLELQEWAPRILNDSGGRPLSAEADKIGGIIAGLRAGDTTANTIRAYRDFKKLLTDDIRPSLERRRGGGSAPPASVPKTAPGPSPWERDPVTKPRSEIEGDEAAA